MGKTLVRAKGDSPKWELMKFVLIWIEFLCARGNEERAGCLRAAVCSAVRWRRVQTLLQRALGYTSQAANGAAVSGLWDCAVLENTRAPGLL